MTRTALVLGATGGIGGAIAKALLRDGWQVRGLTRNSPSAAVTAAPLIDWRQGDAMNREDVISAAAGTSVIVHAVNPEGYLNWETLVLPMIDNTIAAARAANGARVVLPGTIYNFDPAKTPVVSAETRQDARSRKGRIRVALEQRLADAASDVPSLILRAGDFFGPGVRSSWFTQAMIKPGKPLKRIINPAHGAGHSWAYLPDLADAFARLLAMEHRLSPFERVQFEGFYDASGMDMIEALRRVVGRNVPVTPFPWWAMHLLAPFGGFPREASEIAPFWRRPMRFDNTRLVELLGAEPGTPLDLAVRHSLSSVGVPVASES